MPDDEVQKLHDTLKRLQEPRGYFFNTDSEMTSEVLKGLLKNKARYGYMSCPCRLASRLRRSFLACARARDCSSR